MAFILKDSPECVKSELELFNLPGTQTVIQDGQWKQFHPLSNVFDNAPVEFHISGSAEGCVDNEAFHGAFSKSPHEFKHFNLNFIGVYVDGQPVPHNPLELDFSKDQYIRAYQTLFVGTDRMGQDRVLSQEKTTSPYFQGVYSRDTLPPLQENMCAIVNSDDSSQPGTHWLALFVNDKRELEFYDSFGQPPVFYNISTTTYLDVLWNSKVFQSPTSNNDTHLTQLRNEPSRRPPATAVDRLQPPAPPLQQNRLFLPTHGQVTWMTLELVPPSPNYHTTPTGGRFSSRQI
ncbi:uncharacterized protein TNCV_4136631 [Trichonephila clavipes]|nr:uncharacterized protein TNCV_4136631 [Trichonephila clavipes]